MSNPCTQILVGRAPPVLELWLLFFCLQKRPKFPFRPWTIYIVHGGQKIKSPQKFMQVEVDVKCMETIFGVWGLFSFTIMAPFCLPSKMAKKLNYNIYIYCIYKLCLP